VTWYDGVLRWATRLVDQKCGHYFDKTHWRAVQGMDMVIQGLRSEGDGNLTGRGGGSIINHELELQNCKRSTRVRKFACGARVTMCSTELPQPLLKPRETLTRLRNFIVTTALEFGCTKTLTDINDFIKLRQGNTL
jgi:hypothetical protein